MKVKKCQLRSFFGQLFYFGTMHEKTSMSKKKYNAFTSGYLLIFLIFFFFGGGVTIPPHLHY